MQAKFQLSKHTIEEESKCSGRGIYRLVNIVNGKFYIGSTTQSFTRRWRQHLTQLYNQQHGNAKLQAAFNKYAACNFSFDIIKTIRPRKDEAIEVYYKRITTVEDYYLDEAFASGWTYNLQRRSGMYYRSAPTVAVRKVIAPDKTIHLVDNVSRFADSQGLNRGTFSNLLNGHIKSCKGWRLTA